jgi:hypothetical protein
MNSSRRKRKLAWRPTAHFDLIEGQAKQSWRRIAKIRNESKVEHMQNLPAVDLPRWERRVLDGISTWLIATENTTLTANYESGGRLHFQKSVPLHEVVRALYLLGRAL